MDTQTPQDIQDYLTGRRAVPSWFHSKPQRFFIYSDSVTVAGASATGTLNIQIEADTHFLVEALHIVTSPNRKIAQGTSLVRIVDLTLSQPWGSVAVNGIQAPNHLIDIDDISGRGNTPKYLECPNLVRPNSTLQFTIQNTNTLSATYYVTLIGRKVWNISPEEASFMNRRYWFQYAFALPAITAQQLNVVSQMQIMNESDFLVRKLYASNLLRFIFFTNSGTGTVLVNLRDTAADFNFFSNKVPIPLIAGSQFLQNTSTDQPVNGLGFRLKKPYLLRRNTILQGNFDNTLSQDVANDVYTLTMEGIRIFDAR